LSAPIDPERFHHWEPIDVRWGDMDAYGHVNNAAYFTYCESARMGYFERIELDGLRPPGHGPAVVRATCNFRRQVHHPAALEVGARTSKIGGKSFTLEYLLRHRDDGMVVADGSSVVVWVDYDAGRAMSLPEALVERLQALDGPFEEG
jgi:acyl-CoA thioester hydrolase